MSTMKRSPYWLLIYPFAFALYLRAVFGVFTPFGLFPRETDSYYHLRRILATLETFPRLTNYDRYLNFPEGSVIYWPFGFDFIYAAFVKLCTLGQPDEWWTMALASLLTPLIGAATPCLIYLIGERLGNYRAGLWAGLIWAIIPSEYNWIGYIDHHVFESFWLAVYLLFYIRALDMAEREPGSARRNAFFSGGAITAGLLCTTILPLLVPLHAAIIIGQLAHTYRDREQWPRLLTLNSYLWFGLLVSLAPFAATRIAEAAGVNPAFNAVWLVAFLLGALSLAGAWLAQRRSATTASVPRWLALALPLVGLIVIPRFDLPALLAYISYGVGHVFVADPWLAMVQESQPLYKKEAAFIITTYTGLILLWPIVLIWMLKRGWQASGLIWVIATAALMATVPAIVQVKFIMFFAVPYALCLGYFIYYFIEKLRAQAATATSAKDRAMLPAAALILLLLVLPALLVINFSPTIVVSDNRFIDLYPTLQWLARNTPTTSAAGERPGDYGIASNWEPGHWVAFFARRPVVACPLGFPRPLRDGIRRGVGMLMLPPEQAWRLMEEHRIRYLLVSPLPMNRTLRIAHWDDGKAIDDRDEARALQESLFIQLINDGVPAGQASAEVLRRLRLVHESAPGVYYPGLQRPYASVFEIVPGVEVSGTAAPGSVVKISAQVRTPGRDIPYRDEVRADSSGRYACRLPYASGPQRYAEVGLTGPYLLLNNGQTAAISVSEEEVRNGSKRVKNFTTETQRIISGSEPSGSISGSEHCGLIPAL